MITQTAVSRSEVITPTTPTERQVFQRVEVGPGGAALQLVLRDDQAVSLDIVFARHTLAVTTSSQAAVLEELGRMLRIRLREQEQADLTRADALAGDRRS